MFQPSFNRVLGTKNLCYSCRTEHVFSEVCLGYAFFESSSEHLTFREKHPVGKAKNNFQKIIIIFSESI